MKYTPVNQPRIINLILSFFFFIFIPFSYTDSCFYFVLLIITIIGIMIYIDKLSSLHRFESLPKEITEARVVDRRIKSNNHGKGGVSYTHYVTCQFEDIADRRIFTFDEQVSEEVYNWVNIGTFLTVEYVIDDPRLARRLVGEVKNHSSSRLLSYGVEEIPVYPDTAEQEPYPETPVYLDTAEQEP